MPIVFRYNNPVNVSYAPGMVQTGVDGKDGDNGEPGNSIYFTNFEFDNSYNIELALQKIENNYILTDDNFTQIKSIREYKVNDLILSTSGKCYRLISSQDESVFKNYKFNIEYIGSIGKKAVPTISRIVINKLTSSNSNSPYYYEQSLPDCSDVGVRPNHKMYGNWYEIKLYGAFPSVDHFYTNKSVLATEAAAIKKAINDILAGASSAVRFSIEFRLKNTKSYTTNCIPTSEGIPLTFYKSLKFSNLDLFEEGGNNSNVKGKIVYISDYMLDRLHPSGNNISCTLDNTNSMWYKSGIRSNNIPSEESNNWNYTYTNEISDCENTHDMFTSSGIFKENLFNNNRTFIEKDDNGINNVIHVDYDNLINNLPKYSAGSIAAEENISIKLEKSPGEIQASLQNILNNNPENILHKETANNSGESLYFSRLNANNCLKAIDNCVLSLDTKVYTTIKNLSTKEISIIETPVKVNTTSN